MSPARRSICLDETSFITGVALIDGGHLAGR
jgi:hypothetical protein